MAVPNTNTFSLQDVVNELSPSTNDLQSCYDASVLVDFDFNYYNGFFDDLNNFRNYEAFSLP